MNKKNCPGHFSSSPSQVTGKTISINHRFIYKVSKGQGFQEIPGLERLSTVAELNTLGTLPCPRITDFLTWSSKLLSHAKAKSLNVQRTSKRPFFISRFTWRRAPNTGLL